MAIEGPLRELGIHDVFQLLDLSRKTGALRVTSELRDDEGTVYFSNGRVVHAGIRSLPSTLDAILLAAGKISESDAAAVRARCGPDASAATIVAALVEAGAITQREVDRQLRRQIEHVVFELMSWREGFFSFEERSSGELPGDTRINVSTESLLMEGARRIDEWSRIADKVPNLSVVPLLAPVSDAHESQLDLLPHEWEMLTMIDGERDLKGIASALGRSEFEVAKVAYGLISTGVVDLAIAPRPSTGAAMAAEHRVESLARARDAYARGAYAEALEGARSATPSVGTDARLLAARALVRLDRFSDAVDELRRTVHADPLTPRVHLDLGFAAVRVGEFDTARASWEHFLRLAPGGPDATRVRSALDGLERLTQLLEAHADGG
jgi:hypothetical protein